MYQTQDYSLAPFYGESAHQCMGVLQHLQTLLSTDATLADIVHLVQTFQHEFGPQAPLENVIQTLAGRFLAAQVSLRKTNRNSKHPTR